MRGPFRAQLSDHFCTCTLNYNRATQTDETIYTTTIDSIPVDIVCIVASVLDVRGQTASEWLEFVIGLDDLLDAYRYVPVIPAHQRFSISSIYNPEKRVWNFFVMYGHPFGLEAAVLNFNRRPTLVMAVSRRITACATAAFFDDFGGYADNGGELGPPPRSMSQLVSGDNTWVRV